MQRTTIAILLTGALTLTACGGSGSKQTETPKPTVNPAIASFNEHHLAHGSTEPSSAKQEKSGLDTYQANTDNSIEAFNSVNIDGTNYIFASKGDNEARYNYAGNGSYNAISSGRFLSYSRFAVLNLKDYVSDASFFFGQDTLDKDMPTTGSAAYSGHGVHQSSDAKLIETDVNANVDFAGKTAAIAIKGKQVDINLQGKINGSKVSGANNLDAAFYGPDAKELVGSYVQDGNGVFGAVKE